MRLHVMRNDSFTSGHVEFEKLYKERFKEIFNWFIDALKKTAFGFLIPSYTIRCPFVQFLFIANYAELFPEAYLFEQIKLLNDRNFLLYVLTKYLWYDEERKTVDRVDFVFKDFIFPGYTFVTFCDKIKGIDWSDLDTKYQTLIGYFLKIDISNYPEIRLPNDYD
jgi:hypothetical protein